MYGQLYGLDSVVRIGVRTGQRYTDWTNMYGLSSSSDWAAMTGSVTVEYGQTLTDELEVLTCRRSGIRATMLPNAPRS